MVVAPAQGLLCDPPTGRPFLSFRFLFCALVDDSERSRLPACRASRCEINVSTGRQQLPMAQVTTTTTKGNLRALLASLLAAAALFDTVIVDLVKWPAPLDTCLPAPGIHEHRRGLTHAGSLCAEWQRPAPSRLQGRAGARPEAHKGLTDQAARACGNAGRLGNDRAVLARAQSWCRPPKGALVKPQRRHGRVWSTCVCTYLCSVRVQDDWYGRVCSGAQVPLASRLPCGTRYVDVYILEYVLRT
jgi:hypothetical protein